MSRAHARRFHDIVAGRYGQGVNPLALHGRAARDPPGSARPTPNRLSAKASTRSRTTQGTLAHAAACRG